MTLEELNRHRLLVEDLISAQELYAALKASIIKASCYEGMSRSTPTVNDRTQSLVVKCSELEEEIKTLKEAVKKSETGIKQFIATIPDRRTAMLFNLRFIDGYEWKRVAEIIGGKNTENAVKSTVYRFFRSQAL